VDATTPPTSSQRASGSSFYTAMRILPQAQRDAMYEIYSFCRRVDDIADSTGPRPERLAQLNEWRAQLKTLCQDGREGSLTAGLAKPVRDFDLAHEDFLAVIDGMEMDAVADIRAPDWATLDLYCDRVASAVGRLSVRVFGTARENGKLLAHHLGRALQLTNILRDLDEDAGVGRLYLPAEALRAAGITTTDPVTALRSPQLAPVCGELVAKARTHFVEADAIMRRSPRNAVRAPRIMGEVYRSILEGMVARGWDAPRERVRISRARLGWILLRYAIV
jgi:presqualene diphosphate synthase